MSEDQKAAQEERLTGYGRRRDTVADLALYLLNMPKDHEIQPVAKHYHTNTKLEK